MFEIQEILCAREQELGNTPIVIVMLKVKVSIATGTNEVAVIIV